MKIEPSDVNDNDDSLDDHCVLKGDRISLLKCYGQALKLEFRFARLISNDSDTTPYLLHQTDSPGIPCPCRLSDRMCVCCPSQRIFDIFCCAAIIIQPES